MGTAFSKCCQSDDAQNIAPDSRPVAKTLTPSKETDPDDTARNILTIMRRQNTTLSTNTDETAQWNEANRKGIPPAPNILVEPLKDGPPVYPSKDAPTLKRADDSRPERNPRKSDGAGIVVVNDESLGHEDESTKPESANTDSQDVHAEPNAPDMAPAVVHTIAPNVTSVFDTPIESIPAASVTDDCSCCSQPESVAEASSSQPESVIEVCSYRPESEGPPAETPSEQPEVCECCGPTIEGNPPTEAAVEQTVVAEQAGEVAEQAAEQAGEVAEQAAEQAIVSTPDPSFSSSEFNPFSSSSSASESPKPTLSTSVPEPSNSQPVTTTQSADDAKEISSAIKAEASSPALAAASPPASTPTDLTPTTSIASTPAASTPTTSTSTASNAQKKKGAKKGKRK